MAKLGFLGLGIMGLPMARHLMRAGHEVAVWSHTGSKATDLAAAENGIACATPKEVGAHADCIFLCVGDTDMSEEVILGANGIAEGAKPGTVIVDCSTVSPDESRKIGAKLAAKGLHFLDAPCTGSRPGAEGGTLTFMIGGDPAVYEKVKPHFEAMGKNLEVMDATAFALCRDQKLPLKVFSIFKHGALKRVVMGEDEGTLVHV